MLFIDGILVVITDCISALTALSMCYLLVCHFLVLTSFIHLDVFACSLFASDLV